MRLVIRHVLFSNTDRPGVPIPRADLTKLISQNTTSRKQIASYILALAQHNMVELFGLDMMELTRPPVARGKDRRLGTTAEGAKQFVLRSLVPGNMYAAVVDSRREDAQRGLLIVILGLLQVATNGELVEGEEKQWRAAHAQPLAMMQSSGRGLGS